MIILLADSQPLFHSQRLQFVLNEYIRTQSINTGVYIGAANNNQPEFYELACGAFERFGLRLHYHLQTGDEHALQITDNPCLIILSGGNMDPGWNYLSQPPIRQWLVEQRELRGLFIGISAGAIHLSSGLNDAAGYQRYFNWLDVATAVHEEAENWPSVDALQQAAIKNILRIPFGEGVIAIGGNELCSLSASACLLTCDKGHWRERALPVDDCSRL